MTKEITSTVGTNAKAPDWNVVPFDVGCARCGQDLRDLTEPKCPACALEFDWEDAVPIEKLTCGKCDYHLFGLTTPRCPECGEAFTWEGVLDDYHRRKKKLFEYRWRKEPIRSLFSSFALAFQPWKLWRKIDLHDPPATKTLRFLLLIALGVYVLTPFVLAYPGLGILEGLHFLAERYLPASMGNGQGGFWYPFYRGPWVDPMLGWRLLPSKFIAGVCIATYGAGVFGTLILLRQSMAKCKVRNAHVFRVFVYAMLPIAVGPVLEAFALFPLEVMNAMFSTGVPYIGFAVIIRIAYGVAFLTSFLSLGFAYHRYLKMKHAWVVAFVAMIIGGMLASIVETPLKYAVLN